MRIKPGSTFSCYSSRQTRENSDNEEGSLKQFN